MIITEPQKNQLNEFLEESGFNTISATRLNAKDVSQSLNDGDTPLYIAAQFGNLGIAKLLIKAGATVNQAKINGTTPLFIAVQNNNIAMAKLLINSKAIVDKARNDGATSLFIAAENGHTKIAMLLINGGAKIDIATSSGATPLFVTALNGHVEMAKILIAEGAKINQAKNDGTTPIHIATQQGHIEIVKILIAKGADTDKTKNNELTPLFTAALYNRIEIAQALIAAGTNITQIDHNVLKNPFHYANRKHYLGIVVLLRIAGVQFSETMTDTKQEAIEASKLLIEISKRFGTSFTGLISMLNTSLKNITTQQDLLKFNQGLKYKLNQIIHPDNTSDISHKLSQVFPAELSPILIYAIAAPETLELNSAEIESGIRVNILLKLKGEQDTITDTTKNTQEIAQAAIEVSESLLKTSHRFKTSFKGLISSLHTSLDNIKTQQDLLQFNQRLNYKLNQITSPYYKSGDILEIIEDKIGLFLQETLSYELINKITDPTIESLTDKDLKNNIKNNKITKQVVASLGNTGNANTTLEEPPLAPKNHGLHTVRLEKREKASSCITM